MNSINERQLEQDLQEVTLLLTLASAELFEQSELTGEIAGLEPVYSWYLKSREGNIKEVQEMLDNLDALQDLTMPEFLVLEAALNKIHGYT